MIQTHNIPIITISGADVQLRIDINLCTFVKLFYISIIKSVVRLLYVRFTFLGVQLSALSAQQGT
jgi:hypothetical protein